MHISQLEFTEGLVQEERDLEDRDIVQWMSKLVTMNMEDDFHLALLELRRSFGKTDYVKTEDYKMGRSVEGVLKVGNDAEGLLIRSYDEALSAMAVERNIQEAGTNNPYQRWYTVGRSSIRIERGHELSSSPIIAFEETHKSGSGTVWPESIFIWGEHSRRRQIETGFASHLSQENRDEAAQALIELFNIEDITVKK